MPVVKSESQYPAQLAGFTFTERSVLWADADQQSDVCLSGFGAILLSTIPVESGAVAAGAGSTLESPGKFGSSRRGGSFFQCVLSAAVTVPDPWDFVFHGVCPLRRHSRLLGGSRDFFSRKAIGMPTGKLTLGRDRFLVFREFYFSDQQYRFPGGGVLASVLPVDVLESGEPPPSVTGASVGDLYGFGRFGR